MAATAAAACVPFKNSSPFWGTMAAGFNPPSGPAISRDYADGLPYASMAAWFDGAPKALIVLAEVEGDRLIWRSAERQSITTFGPFIVGALGFDIELRGTSLGGGWRADPLELAGERLSRTLDVAAEGERVQVPLTSQFTLGKAADVEIFGRAYRLEHVSEKVSARGRVRYTNEYWVEESDGRCWKTRQIVVPTLPPFNTEVLKYPNMI